MSKIEYIQFYPILRCNLNCHFCFNKGIAPSDDVTVSNFEKMLYVFKNAGINCIDILGGEPTLHPDIIQLIECIYAYRMKTNISSNGYDTDVLSFLSEQYDRDFVNIGISLNSDNMPEYLHEYIMQHRPALKSVLTKSLTIPTAAKNYMGLAGIQYFLLYMDIVDNNDLKSSIPFYLYYSELIRLKKIYNCLDGVFCSGFISDIKKNPELNNIRCPAGTTKLSVLQDGSVYPCYLLFRYEEFKLGNIIKDDFKDILQNPVLDFFKIFAKNNCPDTGCSLYKSCHGGCPAVSYIFYKDKNLSDPRCRSKMFSQS